MFAEWGSIGVESEEKSEPIDSETLMIRRSPGSFACASSDAFLPPGVLSQVQQLSPSALAYLGDAVYELYIRALYIVPPKRSHDYHLQVVKRVRAESQALHLCLLQPHLTQAEQEILRRGRNAATNRSKRVDFKTYQQATSLETLIGYLYITDPGRLFQLLDQLNRAIEITLETPPMEQLAGEQSIEN
jgi:ribonuclease-3 family protein